jgi:ankyrin repeat protein
MNTRFDKQWNEVLNKEELQALEQLAKNPKALATRLKELAAEYKMNIKEFVNAVDNKNTSFLMYAAYRDCSHLIHCLIRSLDVDPNFQGLAGYTALHIACERGCGNAAEALLNSSPEKIKIDITNEEKRTPLDLLEKLKDDTVFFKETNKLPLEEYAPGHFRISNNYQKKEIPAKQFIQQLFVAHQITLDTIKKKPDGGKCSIM